MNDKLPGGCRLIPLPVRGDARGSLVAIESNRDIPFAVDRVFYIFGTDPAVERGHHAHRAIWELAVVVSGSCTFSLSDGSRTVEVRLDDPSTGLIVTPLIWRVMSDFSSDCVLLVLTNAPYDEADYIRDHDEFLRLAAE